MHVKSLLQAFYLIPFLFTIFSHLSNKRYLLIMRLGSYLFSFLKHFLFFLDDSFKLDICDQRSSKLWPHIFKISDADCQVKDKEAEDDVNTSISYHFNCCCSSTNGVFYDQQSNYYSGIRLCLQVSNLYMKWVYKP